MDQWKWAFRNLWRQKRRTLLNASTLSLGMAFLFLGMGWMGGYNAFIFRGIQDFDTGQAQFIRADYLDQERRLPIDLSLDNYPQLQANLQRLDGVAQTSGRLEFLGKLSFHGKSTHLMVRAVDFKAEAGVTVLKDQIQKGEYPQGPGVLVGTGLAAKWGLKPGDTLFLTAFDRQGAENFISARVAGLYSFGYAPIDDHVVYLDLPAAWGLLDTEGQVSRIVLKLKPGTDPDTWLQKQKGQASAGPGALYSWKQFAKETLDAVSADEGSFFFLLTLIFVLATLGMLNSLSMSIHERRRELGTLRALGMRRQALLKLVLREGVALGVVSSVIGAVLALPLALWLGLSGLDLKPYLPPDLPFPFGNRFYAVFLPSTFVVTVLAGWGATLLGAWLPARRAARVSIVRNLSGPD